MIKSWFISTVLFGLGFGVFLSIANGGDLLIKRSIFGIVIWLVINTVFVFAPLKYLQAKNNCASLFYAASTFGVSGAVGVGICAYSFMVLVISNEQAKTGSFSSQSFVLESSFSSSSTGWFSLIAIAFVIWALNGVLFWLINKQLKSV